MSVIELTEISKSVNGKLILSPTTLSIKKGDFFALVGSPSSGKSVVLDIIMNFTSPSSGTVTMFGIDCNKKSSKIRKSVGYCAKYPDFCHDMRISDLFSMCSKMRHVKNHALIKELCNIFKLNTAMRLSKIGLSDRKIVGLIVAMMHSPEVLLLDSPFYGLDKLSGYKLQKVLTDLNKNGTTIFMTTEDITVAQEICSRVAAVHQGTMLDINEQDKLINSDTRRISIKTHDDISALLVLFNIKDAFTKKGYISFLYKNDINDLIQALTSYRISDLQISLPELSEVLSDYYENELEQEQNSVILTYGEADEPFKSKDTKLGSITDIDTIKEVACNTNNNHAESNPLIEDLNKQNSASKDISSEDKPISVQSEISEEISIDEAMIGDIATEDEVAAKDSSLDNKVAKNTDTGEEATTDDNTSDIFAAVTNSTIDSNYDNDLLRRLQEEDMNEQILPNAESIGNKEITNNDTSDNNAYQKKGKRKKRTK